MSIIDGVFVGSVAGVIAGVSIWMLKLFSDWILEVIHKRRVFNWLRSTTDDRAGRQSKSTRDIASHANLTMERARNICSVHRRVFLCTDVDEEKWSLFSRKHRSIYEEEGRGISIL